AATSSGGVVRLKSTFSMKSRSPYGAWETSPSSGEKWRRWAGLDAVSERAPIERPWKQPKNAIIRGRLVMYRASLIAASIASVPELARNVCFADLPGAVEQSFSAKAAM